MAYAHTEHDLIKKEFFSYLDALMLVRCVPKQWACFIDMVAYIFNQVNTVWGDGMAW